MRARTAFTDTLMSAGALVVLLGVLVAIDGRVREEVVIRVTHARPMADARQAQSRARGMLSVVVDAAKDQAREHKPLMLFAFAGTGLLLFMLRT